MDPITPQLPGSFVPIWLEHIVAEFQTSPDNEMLVETARGRREGGREGGRLVIVT